MDGPGLFMQVSAIDSSYTFTYMKSSERQPQIRSEGKAGGNRFVKQQADKQLHVMSRLSP